MAPVSGKRAKNAIKSLKGHQLLSGFRGEQPVALNKLTTMIERFSHIALELCCEIDSIDLNPVFCNEKQIIVADARMILVND